MTKDSVTKNDDTRWIGLSTYISVVLVTTFVFSLIVHAAGMINLSTIPEIAYTVYVGLVLAACYYALGEDAVDKGTDAVMNETDEE